jgi:hypothetical protein
MAQSVNDGVGVSATRVDSENVKIPNDTTSGYGTNKINEHEVSTEDTPANQSSGDEIESGSVQPDKWILERLRVLSMNVSCSQSTPSNHSISVIYNLTYYCNGETSLNLCSVQMNG